MTALRALRLLVLGETWTVPLGLLAVLLACAGLRHAASGAWHHAGGFLLLAGTIGVLAISVGRAPRRPRT